MIYVILLILAVTLFGVIKPKKFQVFWAAFLLVIMMLLVGMRDKTVGSDSQNYIYRFSFVSDLDLEGLLEGLYYEPLFQATVNFVHLFTKEYGWWFLLMSFLCFFPVGIGICKYSKLPLLSVLIYMVSTIHLFPETLNIMRQSVSISCLLLSYLLYINDKKMATLLLFFVALGFHFSCLIVLPFYFVCKYELNKSAISKFLIITFCLGFFSSKFLSVDNITNLFNDFEGVLGNGVEKFGNYSDGKALNAFGLIATMLPINILCQLLIPSNSDDKEYKYLFNFYFIGTMMSNIIYCAVPYGFRFSYNFFVVESILFANKYNKDKRLQYFLVFLIFYYLYYLYEMGISERPNMIIPYRVNNFFF